MGTLKQQVKGTGEKVAGTVKQAVGKATDDAELEGEGENDHARGTARVEVARAVERVKGKVEKAAGAVMDGISKIAEGTARDKSRDKRH